MQILKYHNYKIAVKEGEETTLTIPVKNNLPTKSVNLSCGCTTVQKTPEEYIVKLDKPPLVKWMVSNPEINKFYNKTVTFTLTHEDDTKEKVTINMIIYV